LIEEDTVIRVRISRRSFREDLNAARMKVALALSTGKAIEIKGGNYIRAKDADIIEDATRESIYKIKKKADI
jgi:predicted DNA-binding protein (UPF0251 family)